MDAQSKVGTDFFLQKQVKLGFKLKIIKIMETFKELLTKKNYILLKIVNKTLRLFGQYFRLIVFSFKLLLDPT